MPNPDWVGRAMHAIAARPSSHDQHPGRRTRGFQVMVDKGYDDYLKEAAQRRNISKIGYVRRAVAAFIAYDLGVRFTDVTQHAAQPAPFLRPGGHRRTGASNDNGQGHGDWIVAHLIHKENS